MGFLSGLAKFFGFKRQEAKIVLVGLDNSGKTTILKHLVPPEQQDQEIVPTVGFSMQAIKYKGLNLTAFDMSGQGRYRNLWEHYYKDCNGIIFVIDSNDKLRVSVARDELGEVLKHNDIKDKQNVPILFFANKMDLRDAMSSVECSKRMGLDEEVKNKPWHICATNGLSGEGIEEGIAWFSDQLKQAQAQNRKK